MPVFDTNTMRKLDVEILKATGSELTPVDPEDYFVFTLNGRSYFAIPKHD